MLFVMDLGLRSTCKLVVHLVCLLVIRRSPEVAGLYVGIVIVKRYGQVSSWGGVSCVVEVMGSSSSSGRAG